MSDRLTDAQLLGAGNEGVVLYRADLHAITGDINASLFLSQVLYWWVKMGRRPFYKYAARCDSARPGDSWQEELHFSRYQFEAAREKIAARCYTGDSKKALLEKCLVIYWVDRQNRTWYEVNEALLAQRLQFMVIAENSQPIVDAKDSQPITNDASPQPITDVVEAQPIEESETTTKPTTKSSISSVVFTPICQLFDDTDVKYTLAEIWLAVLGQLQLQMDKSAFGWIKNTKVVDLEDEKLVIRAPGRYAQALLEERLLPALTRTISDIARRSMTLQVIAVE